MIPKQTLVTFPEFCNSGTKTAPEAAKYAAGYQAADVLPAEHLNYFENKSSAGISALNEGVESMESELVNLVTAAGATPSAAANNQVLTSINYLITAVTGTLTNLVTTAKTNLVAAVNEVKNGLTTHTSNTSNPHSVTKTQIGLGNVTNVSTDSSLSQTSVNNLQNKVITKAIYERCLIGEIKAYLGSTAPTGWLICNGQWVSVDDYPELYDVIGDTFGYDDEDDTFQLPDLRGKFLQGCSAGENFGTIKAAGLPNSSGYVNFRVSQGTFVGVNTSGGAFSGSDSGRLVSPDGGGDTGDYNMSRTAGFDAEKGRKFWHYKTYGTTPTDSIYGNSKTVQPPAVTVTYLIRADQ